MVKAVPPNRVSLIGSAAVVAAVTDHKHESRGGSADCIVRRRGGGGSRVFWLVGQGEEERRNCGSYTPTGNQTFYFWSLGKEYTAAQGGRELNSSLSPCSSVCLALETGNSGRGDGDAVTMKVGAGRNNKTHHDLHTRSQKNMSKQRERLARFDVPFRRLLAMKGDMSGNWERRW